MFSMCDVFCSSVAALMLLSLPLVETSNGAVDTAASASLSDEQLQHENLRVLRAWIKEFMDRFWKLNNNTNTEELSSLDVQFTVPEALRPAEIVLRKLFRQSLLERRKQQIQAHLDRIG
jgi:hypothetical protein